MIPKTFTQEIRFEDGRTITIETGKLAKQADGSIVLRSGNTMLLATIVSSKDARDDVDFLHAHFTEPGRFADEEINRLRAMQPAHERNRTERTCVIAPLADLRVGGV